MLIKCEYCNTRVSNRELPLHLKRCVNYRRLLKAKKVNSEDKQVKKLSDKTKNKKTSKQKA